MKKHNTKTGLAGAIEDAVWNRLYELGVELCNGPVVADILGANRKDYVRYTKSELAALKAALGNKPEVSTWVLRAVQGGIRQHKLNVARRKAEWDARESRF